ncbi:uncharacterized protein LOC144132481 isoform X2 [Amblyomma americanum]
MRGCNRCLLARAAVQASEKRARSTPGRIHSPSLDQRDNVRQSADRPIVLLKSSDCRNARAFNETSHCYEGFTRCPASMRSNFTRREEGYRALRAFVCDTQAFKAAMMGRNCTDSAKMNECMKEDLDAFTSRNIEFREYGCRLIYAERKCFEMSWIPSCPMPLNTTMAIVTKTEDILQSLQDCKSMYSEEGTSNGSNATTGNRSKSVTEEAEMRALLQENAQAIAALTDKVKENDKFFKQQTASMESIEGALQELRKEIHRRCGCH